ncbi:MAG: S9 family peptidase, partial [Gemmataceae bacterium]
MQKKPYGSWTSPITSAAIVAGTVGLEQPRFDGQDIFWIEGRPAEAGRNVVVRRQATGTCTDLTPRPFNARNRVHEYGGAAYTVHRGTVYFSNFADQRLYAQEADGVPVPLTPEDLRRYADYVFDAHRRRLIGVCEDHSRGEQQVSNFIGAIEAQGCTSADVLVDGHDFYSTPRLSPDYQRLAWLAWNHPNMPWDGTELWVGEFDESNTLIRRTHIAGSTEEAVFQPEWGP